MVRIFVRHNVKDYAKWRKTYDSFDQERIGMGVAAHATLQATRSKPQFTHPANS